MILTKRELRQMVREAMGELDDPRARSVPGGRRRRGVPGRRNPSLRSTFMFDEADDEEDRQAPAEPLPELPDEAGPELGGLGDEEDVESLEAEEDMSLQDIPGDLQSLRIWLRDAVSPEIPMSQYEAFHKFVNEFVKKAKDLELKPREPALAQRLGLKDDDDDSKGKDKKDKDKSKSKDKDKKDKDKKGGKPKGKDKDKD